MPDVVSPSAAEAEHTGLTILAVRGAAGWTWAMSWQSPGRPELVLASTDAPPLSLRVLDRALDTAQSHLLVHGTPLPP